MIAPLGDKLWVEVDADPTESASGLYFPEQDYMEYCPKCGKCLENLDDRVPCVGRDDFRLDENHDRLDFLGVDYAHDRKRVVWPSTLRTPAAIKATVLATGPKVKGVKKGDRVVVSRTAGGVEAFRIIHETEVMGLVEEE